VRAIRVRRPLPTTEVPFVESKLLAPAGLFPTAEERAVLAGVNGDGTVREPVGSQGGGP
jgi:carbon starvation protein